MACDQGSIPVAWQLYLPEEWATDAGRRVRAGVPETVEFSTKTQIALQQLRVLLADAGYGVATAFRQALSDMGLSTLPEDTPIADLVSATYQRWRIERDYQDLKQDFGLGHYGGRCWRGFGLGGEELGISWPIGQTGAALIFEA